MGENNNASDNMVIKSSDELYDNVNKMTKWLVENVEYFKDFLIAASIFDTSGERFSIENKILIYNQDIDARYLRTKEVWEDMGYMINEETYPILILRNNDVKTAEDNGVESKKYTVEELFDISQTNAEYPEEPRHLFNDLGEAAELILRVKPCNIEYSAIAPVNRYAYYNYSENKISVTNGCKSYDSLFSDVSCEYAHFEFARIKAEKHIAKAEKDGREAKPYKYQRKSHLFHAECAAYALSMMYGVNPGNYNMSQVHQSWNSMSAEQIRIELELVLEAISCIDKRLQNLIADERKE